ncbi:hypothetical protein JRI60_34785 [Archangium violaceum]|uniref:hypothetical protein n=1 Tax=Archangium violaceum TaxID=83451 RepID=UPI00194E0B68|nr:hypothetical protein [Archangium violaceum]QRN94275.1 hypothetical protein JRI60_34785 [Archangium violaceum]
MKKRFLLLAASAVAASGCYDVEGSTPPGIGSFRVVVQSVTAVNANGGTQPLDVVASCISRFGGTRTEHVPLEARGKEDCRYVIPRGQVEMLVDVTALDKAGKPLDFTGPVSFKVVPGDLSDDYSYNWMTLSRGRGLGKLRAQYIYGDVRVWAMDEPVELNYTDGGIAGDPTKLPKEPESRTYAAGSSSPLLFAEPTLAAVQTPQLYDNTTSPFVTKFVTVGRAPESGSILYQNCPSVDLDKDGKPDPQPPVTLLVTGTDPSGFFVTDITACRVPEDISTAAQVAVPEPNGYLPGSYASMFVYNYSYPEGLDPGDLLWTLSGSIQEFTSTTQLTFPSWTVREHVRQLPPNQWDKYLKLNPPVEINLRHCGLKNELAVSNVDGLCGYYTSNLKMESLESGLVKVRHVRFPRVFKTCDFNGDGDVPFFCSKKGAWSFCGDVEPEDMDEVQCNIDCTTGAGAYQRTVCAERTQYSGYGQFVVEMTGPGPYAAGLDDSLPLRGQEVTLSDTQSRPIAKGYPEGEPITVWCDVDTYIRFGASTATTATPADTLLPAKSRRDVTVRAGEGYVAFLAKQLPAGQSKCYVGSSTHTRIMVITKDAVPDLRVDCDENDADADRAQQCRFLHGATYDVVGHLRQVQPARPRWMVMPRDADDLCCHPGEGLECPRPLKACE